MQLTELTRYLNDLLKVDTINDYCPNGLQVEGKTEVKKIITAVTASADAIEHAIINKADVLLVHHGYFWKNENPQITGMKYQRLQKLLQHNIALLAYHLPLDIHEQYGNNIQLAKILNFDVIGNIKIDGKLPLVLTGEFNQPIGVNALAEHCARKLNREPLVISAGRHEIKTIAWCTGAAQDFIELAATQGIDAYLSGEVSERTFYQAKELGIHYLACGHHATERYGIQSLGEHIAQKFNLEVIYHESNNPI